MITLAALLLLGLGPAADPPDARFSGGFIQFWDNMTQDKTRLTPAQ
jgi:hypothetical protein